MALGRPATYKTPAELEKAIDNYFDTCDKGTLTQVIKKGEVIDIIQKIPYSIAGLAFHLGISTKSLRNYETEKPDFLPIITRAKQKCELDLVSGGLTGQRDSRFSQFVAINDHDYKNKTESEITVKDLESVLRDLDSQDKG